MNQKASALHRKREILILILEDQGFVALHEVRCSHDVA
jgi:hypothetical protein